MGGMTQLLAAVAVASLASACVEGGEAMEEVSLSYSSDAVAVVAGRYNMDPAVVNVTWVTSALFADDGRAVDGVAYGCELIVQWWSARWTSGRSVDGPAISSTALAHEMAHCALHLRGDSDHDHKLVEWWGAGGKVEQARAALARSGL